MKPSLGYTLVELMITIAIAALLVASGLSAYTKARDRQLGQTAAEQLLTTLVETQKKSLIGNKDCVGKFTGIELTIADGSNQVSTESTCEGGETGVPTTTTFTGITFSSDYNFTFNPLSQGVYLGDDVDELVISFQSSSGTSYSLLITKSGNIEYQGLE